MSSRSIDVFFAAKRAFSEREVEFFTAVDFDKHVALVAQIEKDDGPAIVAGGRYVRSDRTPPRWPSW